MTNHRLASTTDHVERILVIKWSAMGDVVMATAAIQDVCDAYPQAEIHLNTLPAWRALFADDPRFARVLSVDVRGEGQRVRGSWRWLHAVRAGRYDMVVDLQSSDHTRILIAALCMTGRRIPVRVGYHRGFPYNVTPPPDPRRVHGHQFARAALSAARIDTHASRPRLHVPSACRERASRLAATHGLVEGRYVVLLPGCQAAGYLKRWGAERYASLARALLARGDEKVVLLGGADEREECARIRELGGVEVVNLCGQTEIVDLVPLCAGARLVVANDTGTAHVAAASGTPLVVICGPTDPRRVSPLGESVRTLQLDLPCINCYRKSCGHHSCMKLLTPEMVLEKGDALIFELTQE